ncbi:MAG: ankyrin repeat domain-containing protein [Puniceicoccales bacterium]|jgi:hypothetical protein|nr:ankyrin repeat domain-containing protein [Puniceicoccales bacterium]
MDWDPPEYCAKKFLEATVQRKPAIVQTIIRFLKTVFMRNFPDCKEFIDLAIKDIENRMVPALPKLEELPREIQKAKELLGAIARQNPSEIETLVGAIDKIIKEKFPVCEMDVKRAMESAKKYVQSFSPPIQAVLMLLETLTKRNTAETLLKVLSANVFKENPAAMQAISRSMEMIFKHKFPRDKMFLGVRDVLLKRDVSRESHQSIEMLKVLLHQNPLVIRSIANSIKGVFMDALPDCREIMGPAIIAIEEELELLNYQPGPKLHSEAQVSKVLLQTLLNIIVKRNPDGMEAIVGFIRMVLGERLSYYQGAIDPAMHAQILDIAINDILGSQKSPEKQVSKNLFKAVGSGDLERVQAIMGSRYGSMALDTVDFSSGDTPLHCAVKQEAVEIIELLSTRYRGIFSRAMTKKNGQGKTPADLAETSNNPKIQKIFLEFASSAHEPDRRFLDLGDESLEPDPGFAELINELKSRRP